MNPKIKKDRKNSVDHKDNKKDTRVGRENGGIRKAYSSSEKMPENHSPEIKSARRRRRGDDDKLVNKTIIGNSKSVEDFRDHKENAINTDRSDRNEKKLKERRPSVDDKGSKR